MLGKNVVSVGDQVSVAEYSAFPVTTEDGVFPAIGAVIPMIGDAVISVSVEGNVKVTVPVSARFVAVDPFIVNAFAGIPINVNPAFGVIVVVAVYMVLAEKGVPGVMGTPATDQVTTASYSPFENDVTGVDPAEGAVISVIVLSEIVDNAVVGNITATVPVTPSVFIVRFEEVLPLTVKKSDATPDRVYPVLGTIVISAV